MKRAKKNGKILISRLNKKSKNQPCKFGVTVVCEKKKTQTQNPTNQPTKCQKGQVVDMKTKPLVAREQEGMGNKRRSGAK